MSALLSPLPWPRRRAQSMNMCVRTMFRRAVNRAAPQHPPSRAAPHRAVGDPLTPMRSVYAVCTPLFAALDG
ncbi:hypothetical protein EON66_01130 [archaeon]|nr:MAG: hypothetical protein EON66_01130 [archaeon]